MADSLVRSILHAELSKVEVVLGASNQVGIDAGGHHEEFGDVAPLLSRRKPFGLIPYMRKTPSGLSVAKGLPHTTLVNRFPGKRFFSTRYSVKYE